ncbi:MAG: sigma-70 family RNA polymerase sigma factor [Pseudonocardiaceae bacterium]|nr:sigma-70 family RNA polymerase sigma factor [Pseudonocardiaceae bacterium]
MTAEEDLMRTLHEEHAAALWSYALRLTGGDRARAEDVLQETLLRAWRHLQATAEPRGRAWLFTVAKRVAIDGWRSAATRSEVSSPALPELPVPDGTDRALQGWLVAEALAELSERHREVLLLCYFHGFSVAEASTRLGVAEGTIKSRTHYALRALRLSLEERGVIT